MAKRKDIQTTLHELAVANGATEDYTNAYNLWRQIIRSNANVPFGFKSDFVPEYYMIHDELGDNYGEFIIARKCDVNTFVKVVSEKMYKIIDERVKEYCTNNNDFESQKVWETYKKACSPVTFAGYIKDIVIYEGAIDYNKTKSGWKMAINCGFFMPLRKFYYYTMTEEDRLLCNS